MRTLLRLVVGYPPIEWSTPTQNREINEAADHLIGLTIIAACFMGIVGCITGMVL